MTQLLKRNRRTGEWETVPPARIDPAAWPFIIVFGGTILGVLVLGVSFVLNVFFGIHHP